MDQENHFMPFHPNGKYNLVLERVKRNDSAFFKDVFPDNEIGKTLKGLLIEYLIKQEHRYGWARKSACSDLKLTEYPVETVASHMWGVTQLIMVASRTKSFQDELPNFDKLKALEMANMHDVAELVTGDFTPIDNISKEEKHKLETDAMNKILSSFPPEIGRSLNNIYDNYENRTCIESKFVKDCDKLDFILTAFMLERQGFGGFSEFYSNTIATGFYTKVAREMAETLERTRNELVETDSLYKPND